MSTVAETIKNGQTNKMAFILGYTGETGKALVKEICKRKIFKKVVLIGRREVKLDNDIGSELEQKVVDFDNITAHKEAFKGLDTGFCCLGTTKAKAGSSEGFIKIDHDYVMQSADVAKSMGCKHFLLVSSMGSKKDGCFLYPRVKGQVEEELKELNFDRLSIFKPGLLLCDRVESRPGEAFFRAIAKPIPQCISKGMSISTDNLAKAMLHRVLNDSEQKVETIENREMYGLI